MRVSATVRSQSDKNRFCSAKLVNDRPLSALFWPYLTPASTFPLWRGMAGRNEKETDRVAGYVQWQCAKDNERVTYLEKVLTEPVLGTRYDCWNVRTDKARYWVITSPTNLYSQKLFPSLDYTLSFHIGLMARVQAKRKGTTDDRLADLLAAAFRRWEQAAEALDRSEESEEIQAVGMRCRECLLALVRSVGSGSMVPQGEHPAQRVAIQDLIRYTRGNRCMGLLHAFALHFSSFPFSAFPCLVPLVMRSCSFHSLMALVPPHICGSNDTLPAHLIGIRRPPFPFR